MQEQVFSTCELMPSSPVAESESRVAKNDFPFSGAKDRVQEQMGTTRAGRVGCDATWREGRDGKEHTPEMS